MAGIIKRGSCREQRERETTGTITKKQDFKKEIPRNRKETSGRERKKTTRKKKEREIEQQACTGKLIPSLPHENPALCQNQKESFVH